jgi:hypothetical protein
MFVSQRLKLVSKACARELCTDQGLPETKRPETLTFRWIMRLKMVAKARAHKRTRIQPLIRETIATNLDMAVLLESGAHTSETFTSSYSLYG